MLQGLHAILYDYLARDLQSPDITSSTQLIDQFARLVLYKLRVFCISFALCSPLQRTLLARVRMTIGGQRCPPKVIQCKEFSTHDTFLSLVFHDIFADFMLLRRSFRLSETLRTAMQFEPIAVTARRQGDGKK